MPEVIDCLEQPERAKAEGILSVPTVILRGDGKKIKLLKPTAKEVLAAIEQGNV